MDNAGSLLPTGATTVVVPDNDLRLGIAAFLAGYREPTHSLYALNLRLYTGWCAANGVPVLEARRPHVELYSRHLEAQGYARATVAQRISTVCSFYRWLAEEGFITHNPAANVRRPTAFDESTTLGLDRHEVAQLLDQATKESPERHALVALLTLNGLRVSEACAIDIEDVGEEHRHRIVRITGKGDRPAIVPLAPRTARAVDEARAGRDHGPLLRRRDGNRLDRYTARTWVKAVCRRAGFTKKLSPHSLRHSFVTVMLDVGVPFRDVQAAARHVNPKTTMRYDRARASLDRHGTYILAAYVSPAG